MLAAAAVLDDRGGFEQDCNRCKNDATLRRKWGCDGPTALPEHRAVISCLDCAGRDPACKSCQGSNRVELLECPWRLIEPKHRSAVDAALQAEHGMLPAAGGVHDQAATFVQALPILRNEVLFWRRKAIERATEK